jgi:hypothetical protein
MVLNGVVDTHRSCFSKLYLDECSTVIFRCELIHNHEEPLNLPRKMIYPFKCMSILLKYFFWAQAQFNYYLIFTRVQFDHYHYHHLFLVRFDHTRFIIISHSSQILTRLRQPTTTKLNVVHIKFKIRVPLA